MQKILKWNMKTVLISFPLSGVFNVFDSFAPVFFPPRQARSKTRSFFSVSFHVVLYSVQVSVVADIKIKQTTILMSMNSPRPFPLLRRYFSVLFMPCESGLENQYTSAVLSSYYYNLSPSPSPPPRPPKKIHLLLTDKTLPKLTADFLCD